MIAGGIIIAIGTALATGLVTAGALWRRSQAFAARALVVVVVVGALDDTPMDIHAAEIETPVYAGIIEIVPGDDPGMAGSDVDSAGHEMVSIRLRRALGERQNLGIDYLAYDNALHEGELKLGWYRSFRSSISMKILARRNLGGDPDTMAQIEFSWPLR
jgi:hypothetical protein